jgi:hypothetical protein
LQYLAGGKLALPCKEPSGRRALGRELIETGCRIGSERPGSIWAALGVQS